jgi:hypothetical protein
MQVFKDRFHKKIIETHKKQQNSTIGREIGGKSDGAATGGKRAGNKKMRSGKPLNGCIFARNML